MNETEREIEELREEAMARAEDEADYRYHAWKYRQVEGGPK